jgi:hypothetical protein
MKQEGYYNALRRISWKGMWLDLSYFFLIHPNPPFSKEGWGGLKLLNLFKKRSNVHWGVF